MCSGYPAKFVDADSQQKLRDFLVQEVRKFVNIWLVFKEYQTFHDEPQT